MNHKLKSALFVIAASCLLLLSTGLNSAQTQTPKSETKSTSRWEWSDDGWRRRVEIHGKAEFLEDYSDVGNLSEGGLLRIEEDHNGEFRRLEVRHDESGQLVRRYSVNGESRNLDDNGRKWVAGLLLMAVRQGAIDTERRVKTILRKHGVEGVLKEIASVTGDHARRTYFLALLKNENLSRADRQRALEATRTQIVSDHEKANLLKQSADMFLGDSSLSNAFFQTVATIDSDYEQRRTLSALLKKDRLSDAVLAQMLESLTAISSDHEKATFLLEASSLYTGETRLRNAFLKVVETIKSDHERGRVLNAMLKNKQIG